MHASPVADLALLLMVPLTIVAFATWRPAIAAIVALLFAFMFLPEGISFDFPLVPPMDKHRLATLSIFIAIIVVASRNMGRAQLFHPLDRILIVIVVLDVFTVLTNLDTVRANGRTCPPHVIGDVLSRGIADVLDMIIPFLLGRVLFQRRADLSDLLRCVAAAGIFYVPFLAIEMFVGPRFHFWVYGYYQGDPAQSVRGNMFRPVVFMAHGLAVAIFMYMVVAASAIAARLKSRVMGISARILSAFYVILFPFLRSSAATAYALITLPLIVFTKPKTQMRVAALIVSLVISYQFIRVTELVDVWSVMNVVTKVFGEERAQSLGFRLLNESALSERAMQRPLFGWGGYGRSRVYDAAGNDISVTDGCWIIFLGDRGVLGLFATFGLLTGPVLVARRRLSRMDPVSQKAAAGLSLVQSFIVADLLPNGMFNPMPYVLAGAVAGLALGLPKDKPTSNLPLMLAWYYQKRRKLKQEA